MDINLSSYRQSARTRRTRSRQARVTRAYEQAVRPATEDRYVLAFNVSPMR